MKKAFVECSKKNEGMVINLIEDFNDGSLFCRICKQGSDKWLDGILIYINFDRNLADIFVSTRYFRSFFSEGDHLIVKSIDNGKEYTLKGRLSQKIISMRKQSITIEIEQIIKFENNRISERLDVNYPAIIQPTTSSTSSTGLLFDISSGGVFMSSPTSYDINTGLNIEIFAASEGIISFMGRILRKTQNKIGYSYGILIEEIDNQNALLLNKLIQNLLEDKRTLIDELHRFKKIKAYIYVILMLVLVATILFFSRFL